MRSKVLLFAIILSSYAIAAVMSISVPCARAQEHLILMPSGDSEGLLDSIKGPLPGSCYHVDPQLIHSVMSTSRQKVARLYGTGTLDCCKDEYLVGIKVKFRFRNFSELGQAIMGVFHGPKRGGRKGLASISLVLDGPDL